MGVAVYVRVAVDKPAADSRGIDEQLQAMHAFCDRLGWVILVEYAEAGHGGLAHQRPVLEALLTAASQDSFLEVIVEKIDRLSRSAADFQALRRDLKERGVSIAEAHDDSHPDTT